MPGVFPDSAPVPSSNTKSVVFSSDSVKPQAKETQPLVVPEGTQWTEPTVVKPRTTRGFAPPQKALVTLVQDGDTAGVKTQGDTPQEIMCRLDKIDAPETAKRGKPGQAYGEASKKNLQQLIDGKEVAVSVSYATDDWGRNLCQIEIDGIDVSLKQLEDGMAWLYRKYGNPKEFNQAQAGAKLDKKGLFSDPSAIHPREFKH